MKFLSWSAFWHKWVQEVSYGTWQCIFLHYFVTSSKPLCRNNRKFRLMIKIGTENRFYFSFLFIIIIWVTWMMFKWHTAFAPGTNPGPSLLIQLIKADTHLYLFLESQPGCFNWLAQCRHIFIQPTNWENSKLLWIHFWKRQ